MGDRVGLVEAAREGDQVAFRELAEPHRRGLLAHCYRMCGSLQEAEELVQEAMLRAWRGLDGFEEQASFKSWLYRIATNATLDALKHARIRALPPASGAASSPDAPLAAPIGEPVWLEPFPDALLPGGDLTGTADAPLADAALAERQNVGFAFLQALQRLPPTQRAALLLKDVVGSSSVEVAELLGTTAAAVNSMLQRARETLGHAPPPEPPDEAELEVVGAYVRAFESANVDSLITLLRDDVRVSMPPIPSWFSGIEAVGAFFRETVLPPRAAHEFRGVPTRANGQPAVGIYERGPDGQPVLRGVHVFAIADGRIADLVAFMDPGALRFFELSPPETVA
jgi:RNA polymerase sigma-70 factor, ECF subfamily